MYNAKEMIQAPSYDFLRTEPNLKNVVYLTLSGSHAYGTNKESSDVDLRGVVLEPCQCLYGLREFEQFEHRETDTVLYGLKKFIALCVNGNPNALELLGTREESIAIITPAGRRLRESAGLFLTRRVIQSFGNYATAQLRRLSNALCHDSYTETEQEEHLASVLQGQLEHFNRTHAPMGEGALKIHLSQEAEPRLVFDIRLEGYPLRDFAGIYGEIFNVLKTYGKLNHRNRKKDEAHLYKHAMHLIRLLITGQDILEGRGINTHRPEEHQLLMGIRNGEYTFADVMEMAKEYQRRFAEAAEKTALPDAPDLERVEALMMDLYEEAGLWSGAHAK